MLKELRACPTETWVARVCHALKPCTTAANTELLLLCTPQESCVPQQLKHSVLRHCGQPRWISSVSQHLSRAPSVSPLHNCVSGRCNLRSRVLSTQHSAAAKPCIQRLSIAKPCIQRLSSAKSGIQRLSAAEPCTQRLSSAKPCTQGLSSQKPKP